MLTRSSRRDPRDLAARSELASLIAGFLAAEPRATDELLDRCYPYIARLAVHWIARLGVRGLIDGEDVANDVLLRVHRAARAGKLSITEGIDLRRLVGRMVVRAVLKAREIDRTIKRGGQGQKKPTAPRVGPVRRIQFVDIDELAGRLVDPVASAEDVAVASDEAERICRALDDPAWPAIAQLRLAGHTLPEIARHTGLTISSVERRLRQARAVYEASRDAG